MEKLQEVIRILRRAGGKVISSCGIHVHMDASKHTPQSLKNVLSMSDRVLVVRDGRIDCELKGEQINEQEIIKRALGVNKDG